jgi:hypothetical protein
MYNAGHSNYGAMKRLVKESRSVAVQQLAVLTQGHVACTLYIDVYEAYYLILCVHRSIYFTHC